MIKIVRSAQNNQSLVTQIESIVKDLKKDLLRLKSELNKKKQIRLTKHEYKKIAEENKIVKSKQQQKQQ